MHYIYAYMFIQSDLNCIQAIHFIKFMHAFFLSGVSVYFHFDTFYNATAHDIEPL